MSYVPSDLHFNLENGTTTKTDANLLFGTARATVHAIPMTEPDLAHPERRREPGEARRHRV